MREFALPSTFLQSADLRDQLSAGMKSLGIRAESLDVTLTAKPLPKQYSFVACTLGACTKDFGVPTFQLFSNFDPPCYTHWRLSEQS